MISLRVLDELGREREAEIAYRQAIARDAKFPDAWFNLGVLQEKMGRVDEALSSYERASPRSPPMPTLSTTPLFSSCASVAFRRP